MPRCFIGVRHVLPGNALAATLTAVFLATIGMARAQDFCTNIDDLIDHSRTEFARIADEPTGDTDSYTTTLVLDGASSCHVTKTSSRNWYLCGWEFPYRAQRAYDMFDELVAKMNDCIAGRATLHSDRNVNHPDFYSLRRYEMEQANVTVSVKDKAALGNTFVFIRVQGKNGE